mmetsp:Transcript_16462/g.25120  ORF Transcript_16462/g.25120 Transcript_16462/m.25120 type:complete len:583 (+) Transcript_16462:82-1830(+)
MVLEFRQFLPTLLIVLLVVHQGSSFSTLKPTLSITKLQANVASDIILGELGSGGDGRISKKRKLTRPERKAQEREKKARRKNSNHRKHNYAARATELQGKVSPGEGRYDLHSKSISSLNIDSSADDVLKAIKRAQNLHDVHDIRAIEHFLLEKAPPNFAYGYMGSLLSRLAVAALHLGEQSLARKALDVREANYKLSARPMESAAIIRGLLRVHNVSDAFHVLDGELPLPDSESELTTEENQELIKYRALSLGSIASRHFFENELTYAIQACEMLTEIGPIVREAGLSAIDVKMPWARIVKGAAQCESKRRDGKVTALVADAELPCNLVYSVLGAMTTFPSDNDDRTYEILSNSLIRRVVFVTGAVDMKGCPVADRGEVAFIGRSNVGKSSLVNMITNRKSLAYTSKTPGKTQQFNFFAVNDKPERAREIRYGDDVGGEKDLDSFYIVDLPGFGFAKVPENIRNEWSKLMSDYVQSRKTLKTVFHLIDSRHGSTSEDVKIMKQLGEIMPKNVKYVVVLTKADKNVKGMTKKNEGKVSRDVMESLRETMKENKLGKAPVILSSAESKLGRDDIWRYLKVAAEA